jgi:endonuclease YncB( thermonuclease family)
MRTAQLILCLLAFATSVITSGSHAADRRTWVTVENCAYLPAEYNDGDSFRVRHGNEEEFVARLYYVDAPEANLTYAERTREQSVHFGASLDATLAAGARARARVQELLARPFVIRTRWAIAPGRGRDARYYVIVEVDGRGLAEILVSEGLARTKGVAPNLPTGEKARDYMERLRDLEAEALT